MFGRSFPKLPFGTDTINGCLTVLFKKMDQEVLGCKTACKTFQGPGEKSVEKFPPQVV
jgi:hypothetical protein